MFPDTLVISYVISHETVIFPCSPVAESASSFRTSTTTCSWRRRRMALPSPSRETHLGKPWDSKNERRNNERVTNNFLTFQHDKSWTKVHKQDPEVRNMSVGLRTSNLLYHLASYFNFSVGCLSIAPLFISYFRLRCYFVEKTPKISPGLLRQRNKKSNQPWKQKEKGQKISCFAPFLLFLW